MQWRCRTSATAPATSADDYGANIARDLGGWSERVEDPAQIGDAIRAAAARPKNGRAALLEFITSQEQGFSHPAAAPPSRKPSRRQRNVP